MKTKKLVMSTLTLAALVGGSVTSLAATIDESTKGTSEASVQFEADTEVEIPDPGGEGGEGETPWEPDPEKPLDPKPGELMITYISDLNFGTQKKSDDKFYAAADKGKDGVEAVPFVATKDSRGSERKGWTLTAKLDAPLTAGTSSLDTELKLVGNKYNSTDAAAPAAVKEVTLSGEAQDVSTANELQGVGAWSMAMGELQGEEGNKTTTGVVLEIPKSVAKDAEVSYSTTVTWELISDPVA